MKRFLSLILALLLCAVLAAPALAAGDADLAAAQDLNALGLFAGKGTLADGTPDFALGDKMNRMEAVTMLVRLLGAEQTALAGLPRGCSPLTQAPPTPGSSPRRCWGCSASPSRGSAISAFTA